MTFLITLIVSVIASSFCGFLAGALTCKSMFAAFSEEVHRALASTRVKPSHLPNSDSPPPPPGYDQVRGRKGGGW